MCYPQNAGMKSPSSETTINLLRIGNLQLMSSDTDKKDVMYNCWWTKKKEKIRDLLFSTTKALVGTLMTVGDVNDIFPIAPWPLLNLFSGKWKWLQS